MPESASSRMANDEIRENFSSREASALSVFVPGGLSDEVAIVAYARGVAGLNGVARVDALTGYYTGAESMPPNELSERFSDGSDDTWVQVVPAVEPISVEGEALVRELRAIETPFAVQVAGPSAELVDTKDSAPTAENQVSGDQPAGS